MLRILESSGYELPPKENVEDVTATQILDKIHEFVDRCSRIKDGDLLASEFMQLLTTYPVSMCKPHMTATSKRLMALFYFYRMPKLTHSNKDENEMLELLYERNEGLFSYESLAMLFLRSKATVHDVIEQEKAEVTALVEQKQLRRDARALALEELKQEEKLKLLENNVKESEK